MYLVDEDDNVGILFQLLDKHLHAFLKLSAILCTGYDTRHVECHQAFVEEHRGTVVGGNHLCQTFDDGTLAHTGFANEDGVVLLATSQNLDDALYLVFTTYTRVELILGSQCRQVRAEGVEHRGLRLGLLALLGSGSNGRTVGRLARGTVIAGALGVLVFLVVFFRQSYAVLHAEQGQRILVIHVIHFQYLFGTIVSGIVQDGQQHVLFLHTRGML